MIRAEITGVAQVVENLRVNIPAAINNNLNRLMLRQVIKLQRYVILNKLEGQVLRHRTGHLERSITYDVQRDGSAVTGIVGVGREAPYGTAHETGGTFSIPQQLRKSKLGKDFIVKAHTATFPQRAFLRPSLLENEQNIVEGLSEGLA